MKRIMRFMTKQSTLNVLAVTLALIGIVYIEHLEWNRTIDEVSVQMLQVIQSDNSF